MDFQSQIEESVEQLQDLISHLQNRAREGTLRSDRDTYAFLPSGGGNPGNWLLEIFLLNQFVFTYLDRLS